MVVVVYTSFYMVAKPVEKGKVQSLNFKPKFSLYNILTQGLYHAVQYDMAYNVKGMAGEDGGLQPHVLHCKAKTHYKSYF